MLFEAAQSFLRADAAILNDYGHNSNVYLPAGEGLFGCKVIRSSDGKRAFTYARARTYLSPERGVKVHSRAAVWGETIQRGAFIVQSTAHCG
jgi:hypothetical protein